MSHPLVSVVLPVYNAGTMLPLALESIRRQTFRDWELILIDDGSTDGCMTGFRSTDDRVRVIRDEKNTGLAARLNQGIDLARGKYLARMDQDDVAYPGRLETQVKFLDAHPDIDLAATRAMVFLNDGSAAGLFPFRGTHAEICAAPWRGFYFPHPTWMGRIEWFRRHRYRLPEIVRGEDQDLLLRSYATSRFACLPEVLMGYRQSDLALSKILLSRRNLALAQWSVHRAQGRTGMAFLGFATFALKAAADAVLGAAGARGFFTSRLARAAAPADVHRWQNVWKELRRETGTAPSPGTPGAP